MYLQELINTFNNNESVNYEKVYPYKKWFKCSNIIIY